MLSHGGEHHLIVVRATIRLIKGGLNCRGNDRGVVPYLVQTCRGVECIPFKNTSFNGMRGFVTSLLNKYEHDPIRKKSSVFTLR